MICGAMEEVVEAYPLEDAAIDNPIGEETYRIISI